MSIGIIILNYNSASETIRCIQCIEKYNSAPIKYIVVDNGSSNKDEVRRIESFLGSLPDDTRVTFVASDSNDGYARGNNKGLEIAFHDCEIEDILILNNDVFFDSDLIPELLSRRNQLQSPGILTPVLYNIGGGIEYCCARTFPSNWEVILPFLFFKKDFLHILRKSSDSQKILLKNPEVINETSFPIGMPSGACMLIGKSLFEDIGGFDNGTFLYYEENILCKKLQEKGFVNYCIPTVHAQHVGGASTSKSNNLFLQKCNVDSADYYLRHFGKMNLIQSIIWRTLQQLWF